MYKEKGGGRERRNQLTELFPQPHRCVASVCVCVCVCVCGGFAAFPCPSALTEHTVEIHGQLVGG